MVDLVCEIVFILLKYSGKLLVVVMGYNVVVVLESDM